MASRLTGRHSKHRRDRAAPEIPPDTSREDALWNEYAATKAARGSDDTTTWDRFFDWWKAAT